MHGDRQEGPLLGRSPVSFPRPRQALPRPPLLRTAAASLAGLAAAAAHLGATPADQPGLLPGDGPAAAPRLAPAGETKARALALYFEGLGFARRHDRPAMIARFLDVLRLDPRNLELAKHLSDIYAAASQPNDALAVLEESVRQNPNRPEAYIHLSELCYHQHNNSEEVKQRAFSIARQAVERFPDRAAVHGNLAALLLEENNREEAARVIEQAAARQNPHPRFWLELAGPAGVVWPHRDEPGRAKVLALYQKALALAPHDPEVLEETGDFLAAGGSAEKAAPMYEALVARRPDDLRAREKLAHSLALAGQPDDAATVWKQLLEIDPQSHAAHLALSRYYAKTGDRRRAVAHRAEAFRFGDEESLREAMRLVHDMIEAGLAREALPILERAEFNAPDSPEPPYRAAIAHRLLGEADRAVAAFDRAAHAAAADEETAREFLNEGFYFDWAMVCTGAGRTDAAEEHLRKAISLVPKDQPQLAAKSYNALAYMWIEQGRRLDEAGPLVERALKLDPENPAYLDSLGWFHFHKGNHRKALDLLRKAAAHLADKPDAEVGDHLARTLWELGERKEAIKVLDEAAALPSATDPMRQRLDSWRAEVAATPAPGS